MISQVDLQAIGHLISYLIGHLIAQLIGHVTSHLNGFPFSILPHDIGNENVFAVVLVSN